MYNVARSTNRRAVTQREKYKVKTRLGFKSSILHFPFKPVIWIRMCVGVWVRGLNKKTRLQEGLEIYSLPPPLIPQPLICR